MGTADIETLKIALSPRTIVVVLIGVISVVASYFIAAETVNSKIDDTNKRIDNNARVLESQQSLIMTNRYKDSLEKAFIQLQIDDIIRKRSLNK